MHVLFPTCLNKRCKIHEISKRDAVEFEVQTHHLDDLNPSSLPLLHCNLELKKKECLPDGLYIRIN